MKHKISIWKKNKEAGSAIIEAHLEINEFNIEDYALTKYLDEHRTDDRFEYSARLDETIH